MDTTSQWWSSRCKMAEAHVVDEFTRESLADVVAESIDADATVATLGRIAFARGCFPAYLRCDNGPELTTKALRDWCRFTGTGTSYIEPGLLWQNPWVESYGGRMRDELLAIEIFDTLLEAHVLISDLRDEYNNYRPHSALGRAVTKPGAIHSPPPSSLGSGGPTTHPNPHNGLTYKRGPVTVSVSDRRPAADLY